MDFSFLIITGEIDVEYITSEKIHVQVEKLKSFELEFVQFGRNKYGLFFLYHCISYIG